MKSAPQKEFLENAKRALEQRFGRMTWDEFAERTGTEARTLKAYRAPEDSKSNYREMPQLVRQAIKACLTSPQRDSSDAGVLIGALSCLVIRQAKLALVDRQVITGLSRYAGARAGLSDEDRKAMALVSRACLESGVQDFGGEIHTLLVHCKEPLGQWLTVKKLMDAGYQETVLIDPDHGIPTPEAQELAENFGSLAAHLEERIFSSFKETLAKFPSESADEYYSTIREFVVRNPVVSSAKLLAIGKKLPPVLWLPVQREFYEPFPASHAGQQLRLCAHCNSLLKPRKPGSAVLVCQSRACRNERPMAEGKVFNPVECHRVRPEIHQFWVEPGIHEIWLYDELKSKGVDVALYPHQDRVDVGTTDERFGVDLKAYASAETLGHKLARSIGGLAFYEKKLLVIPDWIIRSQSGYLDRLRTALGENAKRLQCCAVSDVVSIVKVAPNA